MLELTHIIVGKGRNILHVKYHYQCAASSLAPSSKTIRSKIIVDIVTMVKLVLIYSFIITVHFKCFPTASFASNTSSGDTR